MKPRSPYHYVLAIELTRQVTHPSWTGMRTGSNMRRGW